MTIALSTSAKNCAAAAADASPGQRAVTAHRQRDAHVTGLSAGSEAPRRECGGDTQQHRGVDGSVTAQGRERAGGSTHGTRA